MDAQVQLDSFIDRFSPEVAALGRATLAWLSPRMPGAWWLVYDNYNALAIAVSTSDRLTGSLMSVALYPRWTSLFFSRQLPDPHGLLEGTGNSLAHVKIREIARLDHPGVAALVDAARARARPALGANTNGRLVIKSISPKQRPRRG